MRRAVDPLPERPEWLGQGGRHAVCETQYSRNVSDAVQEKNRAVSSRMMERVECIKEGKVYSTEPLWWGDLRAEGWRVRREEGWVSSQAVLAKWAWERRGRTRVPDRQMVCTKSSGQERPC